MTWYPRNKAPDVKSDQPGDRNLSGRQVFYLLFTGAEAATADTDGVHAAVTDTGSEQEITTGFTNPPYPRNITATAGGTATDVKAIQVIVAGTNILDEAITETLPAFTVNTAGTVTGSKAFKTVTSVTIPAHDGTAATTAIGFGDKLGLPIYNAEPLFAKLNGTRETTLPTNAVDGDELDENTIDLSSALNGTAVEVWLIAEGGN